MKTTGQVVHHLRQRVFRAQKKYLSFHLKRSVYGCQYNVLSSGDYATDFVNICTHPENLEMGTLDVAVGQLTRVIRMPQFPRCNVRNAKFVNCPLYTPRKSKEELQIEFRKSLLEKSKNPADIAESHPDIAQLLWVLGAESLDSLDNLSDPVESIELTAEDKEGIRNIEQATMEASMDGYVPDDYTHKWEDDCPGVGTGGIHETEGGLSCIECNAVSPVQDLKSKKTYVPSGELSPEVLKVSLMTTTPPEIRKTLAFRLYTWLTSFWGK